jgi:hypothetical protein
MRWILSFLLLGLLAVVQAASSSGNKLLVVLEELAEKSKYSKYLGDLEGTELLMAFVCLFRLNFANIGKLQLEASRLHTNHQRATKLRCLSWARELTITYSFYHQSRKVQYHKIVLGNLFSNSL